MDDDDIANIPVIIEEDIELSDDSMENEIDDVDRFWTLHAGCVYRCTDMFAKDRVRRFRDDSRAVDEMRNGVNQLNSLLVAMIHIMQRSDFVNKKRYANKEHERRNCVYMIESVKVCRTFFLFCHTIGKDRWESMLRTYKVQGLVEKRHGLCQRTPQNTLSSERKMSVVRFLRNYSEEHAIVTPTWLPQDKNVCVLLPSGVSKSCIYNLYRDTCRNTSALVASERQPVSSRSFYRIWKDFCPKIVFVRPRRDLCVQCYNQYTECGKLEALCEKDRQKYSV